MNVTVPWVSMASIARKVTMAGYQPRDHKNKEDLALTTVALHMPLNRSPGGQSSPSICALSMYLGKNLFCYLLNVVTVIPARGWDP